MRKFFLILILSWLTLLPIGASPKFEMRAVWLTTNWGLDWPSQPARTYTDMLQQQAELCNLLDEVASLGFNTIFFQARIKGEVFYNSNIEPWSHIVSGESGRSPGYDPLAFVIEECHKRGLECHAWFITIPAGSTKQAKRQGSNSLPARHPEMCIKFKNEWFIDPGHPHAADYIASIAEEVAHRYDIDGIHLDYIRYPGEYGNFPDNNTYNLYSEGESLQQWRQDNISHIVRTVCDVVKNIDDAIMVSTAPLGRYEIIDGLPPSDWVCTGSAAQDVALWLEYADNDFIVPMMYYPDVNYFPYLAQWVELTNSNGYVVAGLGAYRMEKREGNWSIEDLSHQIAASRHYGAAGQAFFRLQHLRQFPDLAHLLAGNYYRNPALIPPMPHADLSIETTPVENIQLHIGATGDTLVWQPAEGAIRYAVYASVTDSVDITDASQLIYTWATDTMVVFPPHQYASFAVTAIDRYRRESNPAKVNPPAKRNPF